MVNAQIPSAQALADKLEVVIQLQNRHAAGDASAIHPACFGYEYVGLDLASTATTTTTTTIDFAKQTPVLLGHW